MHKYLLKLERSTIYVVS